MNCASASTSLSGYNNLSKVRVSVVIPVKNEAGNLARCLAAVRWADEVFVVDSRSTDSTVQIATDHGATIVQFEFSGVWPKKKNWALDNLNFRNKWVFLLDADEVLHRGVEQELREIVERDGNPFVGYWINRRFSFMGKWLRHAYYPNWNLRLFLHKNGRFEKLTNAATHSGDNEVHEHVIVDGPSGFLNSEMDHYAFPTVEIFVEKHNRYSNWEAHVEMDQRLSAGGKLQLRKIGLRRIAKTVSHRLPFRPTLRFLYVYFWQRGFLDGIEGYYFARLHAFYEFLCVAKTRELQKQRANSRFAPTSEEVSEDGKQGNTTL